MTTRVRLPDGTDVNVATDDPQQAAAAARKHWAAKQAAPAPTRSFGQTIGDAIGNISDNMLPNWGDEVYAAGAAARALVDGKPVGAAYDHAKVRFAQNQKAYKDQHPVAHVATAVAGTGIGLAAPQGRVAEGAGLGLRMLHGAGVGAAYGAFAGAGQGESLGDRAANALQNIPISAAAGGLMVPLVGGAAALGRRFLNVPGVEAATRSLTRVPRAVLQRAGFGNGPIAPGQRAAEQADRMIADRMTQGHIQTGMGQQGAPASPQAITDEMARRQAMGVPAIPGDVTEPMRNLTGWASRGMGPGQTRVRQALDARKATEAARVRQHVVDQMGPAVDPELAVEQHMLASKEAAAPMYREAYAQPMVITPEIHRIMQTPAFVQAVQPAVQNIRNGMGNPAALGFQMNEHGAVSGINALSTEGFDQVIRAMGANGRRQAVADGGMNPITGHVTQSTDSVHINNRARDLRQLLGDQNEAYREVTERYADDMAQRDAFTQGRDVAKLTGHEVNAQARHMPDNAQGAWSIGARTALADRASEFGAKHPTGNTAAYVRSALGDDVKQNAIGTMMGNNGSVRRLQDRLEAEHQGNILYKDVEGNSKTASRQAQDADMDAATGAAPFSNFSVPGVLRGVLNHIVKDATPQYRTDIKARIARIITETNPATVRELMAEVAQRAQHDRDFAGALHRSGITGARVYGSNIVNEQPDDPALDYTQN